MSIKSTQLHGMERQIFSWIAIIEEMEGYEEEDYNPYYELRCNLEDARDQIGYALAEEDNE
jgi:hypothetical protein